MDEIRAAKGAPSSSSKSKYETPPPKISAPSPVKAPQHPSKPPKPPAGVTAASANAQPPPETEGAKLARLRRVCEVKPSGKCAAGTELHNRWKNGDKAEREALVELFEKVNWDKDVCFLDGLASSKDIVPHEFIEDFHFFNHYHHPRRPSSKPAPRL